MWVLSASFLCLEVLAVCSLAAAVPLQIDEGCGEGAYGLDSLVSLSCRAGCDMMVEVAM
jgi:hypothetical protein